MKHLRAFWDFWWDFIVGDDWRMAVGVVVALAISSAAAHAGVPMWWFPPIAVVAVLFYSLNRVSRRG